MDSGLTTSGQQPKCARVGYFLGWFGFCPLALKDEFRKRFGLNSNK